MTSTEDFINKFHSLEGTTLGERKKELFLLFNSIQNRDEIHVEQLRPRTALEEVFKIEALIFFKKVPQLLEVLQSENTVFIQKVLNVSRWFVPEAFRNLSGEDLVNEVFPNLSYNTKLKLLNKLAQHLEEKCEEFFDCVKAKYGMFLASKLLPGCRGSFILDYLKRYKIELTPNQLSRIIKNNPSLTEEILEVLDGHNYKTPLKDKYTKIFVQLASSDNQKFLKLNEKYSPEIRLGSATSKKFIRNNQKLLMDDPKKVYKLLKQKQIPLVIKGDFPKFYGKIFPKSYVHLKENFSEYLDLLQHISSPAQKYQLMSKTFQEVYGEDIKDQEGLMTLSLLGTIPTDEREAWMDTNSRPEEITEISWISLMRLERSLPLLKSKFLKSNYSRREDVLKALIDTYKFNDALGSLGDLFEYLLVQQTNINEKCWKTFLYHFGQSVDLRRLSHEQWGHLCQIMNFVDDSEKYLDWLVYDKYLQYCFDHNLPHEDALFNVLKISYLMYIKYPKDSQNEKRCLLEIPSLLPKLHKDPNELKSCYIEYLKTVVNQNRKKKHNISLFLNPEMIEFIKNTLATDGYTYDEEMVLGNCLTKEFEKSSEHGLFSIFLSRKPTQNIAPILMFLLKNHPLSLDDCIKPLSAVKSINFPLHFYKYFDHLQLSQNVSEKCLQIIESDDEEGDAKRDAATCLVHTMSTRKFLEFVSSYKPNDPLAKMETKKEQNIYKTQQGLLNSLNQLNPSSEMTETILNFAQGDYLKLVNKALFSNVQNLKENRAGEYLKVLNQNSVSAKKHGVMLSSRIFDVETVKSILMELMKKEKNSTIKKSLLKANFNYFARNPERWAWELLKENAKKIEDPEGYNILAQFEKIPKEYFTEYVTFTWKALDSNANPEEILTLIKSRFLECITENTIKNVPKELCFEILQKHLFKSQRLNKFEKQVQILASKYLIFHTMTSTGEERSKEIVSLIQNCINATWHKAHSAPLGRQYVYNFIKELCAHFLDKKRLDGTILEVFVKTWNELLHPYEAFDHYAYLYLTLLHTNCLNKKWTQVQLGENLAQFLTAETSLDVHIFCKTFKEFKEKFGLIYEDCDVNESYLMMAEGVLKFNLTTLCPLVLVLLPKKNAVTLRAKRKLDGILNGILKDKNAAIQMEVQHYFAKKSDVREGWWDWESVY